MATAQARLSDLPLAPRKVRLVADLVRGKKVSEARDILAFTLKASALPMQKLLASVVANAESAAAETHDRVDTDDMVIAKVIVNEGRTLHRFLPQPRGRASRIRKRSCHIEMVISTDKV